MSFRKQVHRTEVVKADYNYCVDVHSYEPNAPALIDVFGGTNEGMGNIELWLDEDEVRALRDALNEILGEP